MRKGNLTREQAIRMVGLSAVEAVEAENCDFSNRVQTDGDEAVEFTAYATGVDTDGNECTLVAYYYQDQADLDDNEGDLGMLDWEIAGYDIL